MYVYICNRGRLDREFTNQVSIGNIQKIEKECLDGLSLINNVIRNVNQQIFLTFHYNFFKLIRRSLITNRKLLMVKFIIGYNICAGRQIKKNKYLQHIPANTVPTICKIGKKNAVLKASLSH